MLAASLMVTQKKLGFALCCSRRAKMIFFFASKHHTNSFPRAFRGMICVRSLFYFAKICVFRKGKNSSNFWLSTRFRVTFLLNVLYYIFSIFFFWPPSSNQVGLVFEWATCWNISFGRILIQFFDVSKKFWKIFILCSQKNQMVFFTNNFSLIFLKKNNDLKQLTKILISSIHQKYSFYHIDFNFITDFVQFSFLSLSIFLNFLFFWHLLKFLEIFDKNPIIIIQIFI